MYLRLMKVVCDKLMEKMHNCKISSTNTLLRFSKLKV